MSNQNAGHVESRTNCSSSDRSLDLGSLRKNLIYFLPHLLTAGRFQIAHRTFHVGVTKPLLHGALINTSPQAPSCKRRTKLVQPEVFLLQIRTLGTCLQIVQEVLLWIAARGWEREATGFVSLRLQSLQFLSQPRRNWNR